MPPPRLAALALLALATCAREEILHGLEEAQANQVLVALDEGGVRAEKKRDEAAENAWRVEVGGGDAARAQRVLAERELPRPRAPGFGEVFGKGSVVPTASEERALYLHALSGELSRSVEAIDGVVQARVHLALPAQEAFRTEAGPPPRASLLVKARCGARPRLEALAGGLQALVAGAVAGLDPAQVSVVVAESQPPPIPAAAAGGRHLAHLGLAALALALAVAAAASALGGKVRPWLSGLAARRRPEPEP